MLDHDTAAERWLPVPGYEGKYEVSDLGRVRSVDRDTWRNETLVRRRGKVLWLRPNDDGYPVAALYDGVGRRDRTVHRMVLEAFVGLRPDGMQGCHGNGIRTDNRLVNLRWDTHAANTRDRAAHGNDLCGARNHNTKLCPKRVREIRAAYENGASIASIADRYGMSPGAIYSVAVNRRSWAWVA